jgi:hypothetical protein
MLLGCRCSSGRPPGRFQLRTAAEMAARGHLRATNWTCFPRAVRPGWRPGIMHHIYAPSGRGSLSCSPCHTWTLGHVLVLRSLSRRSGSSPLFTK